MYYISKYCSVTSRNRYIKLILFKVEKIYVKVTELVRCMSQNPRTRDHDEPSPSERKLTRRSFIQSIAAVAAAATTGIASTETATAAITFDSGSAGPQGSVSATEIENDPNLSLPSDVSHGRGTNDMHPRTRTIRDRNR